MSEQELDLRRSLQIVRRHKIVVGLFAALGLIAGVVSTVVNPPMLSSSAFVVLSPSVHDTRTQALIARSDPVLAPVRSSIDPAISLAALRRRIEVKSPSYNLISISAQGTTATQAERTANAVARSYVGYVSSNRRLVSAGSAQLLQPASNATGTSLAVPLLDAAGPGLLLGVLAGSILVLAVNRSDRRLRERGELANSIGTPVLASIFVERPSSTAGWSKLLAHYKPGAVDGWHLRMALRHLQTVNGSGSVPSLAVLSLSSDGKALALGPQLAVFASSLGIPTALVIGPQQDANASAALRAACTAQQAQSLQAGNLRVAVRDDHDAERLPEAALTIVVGTVDGKSPKVGETLRATTTVLGVSAGAATADQLARVAASAAAEGRHIAGILVADPDPADHTTGRLSQRELSAQRRTPMRVTGTPTGTNGERQRRDREQPKPDRHAL